MNQYSVAKALLGLYTKLPDATLHIQNSVDKLVRRSFYYDRNTSTYNKYLWTRLRRPWIRTPENCCI